MKKRWLALMVLLGLLQAVPAWAIPQLFAEHTIKGNFDDASSVYATDVDGDGDVDVLGEACEADDITWWENLGTMPLSNGSFELGPRIPTPWKGQNLTLKDKRVCTTAYEGSCSFLFIGSTASKALKQVLNISGNAGDSFTLQGWSKAQNPSTKGGPYCLQARLFHTDATKKTYKVCFAKRTHAWQRRGKTFTIAKDYNKVVVSLLYYKQSGKAWFDDVRLVVSPFNLSDVNDFLYQLQRLKLGDIGNTAYDLVVMDYSADGSEEREFTAAQIAALKHSSGGEKIVLAYMSIGEAEDYRFYWQSGWKPRHPVWLDVENPDWEGNYKVRYWYPGWQAIIFDYTDRLLDAGFDGAYLDIIDAYEYYEDKGRTKAAKWMVDFVAAIRAHARARDPDFYIFPQNAPELATRVPSYLNSVDGIGQEDIYYGYKKDDVMTPPKVTAEMEKYLDVFKNAGKLVLTVDYATTQANIDDAYAKSQAKGYVPFVTVRGLNRLIINPGHEPD